VNLGWSLGDNCPWAGGQPRSLLLHLPPQAEGLVVGFPWARWLGTDAVVVVVVVVVVV